MSHIIVNFKYYSLKEQNTSIGQFNTWTFIQSMDHQICQCLQSIFIKVPMKWKTIAAYLKGKMQKNGVFLFGISRFVLDILGFLISRP